MVGSLRIAPTHTHVYCSSRCKQDGGKNQFPPPSLLVSRIAAKTVPTPSVLVRRTCDGPGGLGGCIDSLW